MTSLKPATFFNGRFQNPIPTRVGSPSLMFKVIWKAFRSKAEAVPRRNLGPFRTDPSVFTTPPATGLRITWMGHSSLLVEIDGVTVLIDPVWSQRASMVQWLGPKRFFAPPISIADLPQLDAVLLSHDHYDHLDASAMRLLVERTPVFVCSLGMGQHLLRWGIPSSKITEINWMDQLNLSRLQITALPARHFTGRGLKRFGTLWSSFVLEGRKHRVYFGADSGYYNGFKEIGTFFPQRPDGSVFDLAMVEIGAFDELWSDIHMGPDNAIRVTHDIKAKALLPIHWGLFNLALHAWDQPIERVVEVAAADGRISLLLPEPGKPTDFDTESVSTPTYWWRRYQSGPHARLIENGP